MQVTEGTMVGYVLKSGRAAGQTRPAMVVRHWGGPVHLCNLLVFLDGSNDRGAEGTPEVCPTPATVSVGDDGSQSQYVPHTVWVTSVHPDETKQPGTWHMRPATESAQDPVAAAA